MTQRTVERQAAQVTRLRALRLQAAGLALEEAHAARAEADRACDAADAAAAMADRMLVDERTALAADPAEAERRLALVDRSLFGQAVARSASNDATEALAVREREEAERRRAMVLADARHRALDDHARKLRRRAARRRDERTETDALEARRER